MSTAREAMSAAAAQDKRPAQRLQGRRIVITGAASGIGRRTAQLFAEEGAALTLLDRDAEGLSSIAAATRGWWFAADVSDEAAVARAVESGAAAMGGIDGVVNAAGIMMRGSVAEVSVADWRRVIDINLTGMYIVVRACLPWLVQTPGATVVNLGSGQSLLPNSPNRTAYSASKGGVLNLSRALAAELAPAIRVNCVCPGLVDTPMAAGVQANVGNYALGRLATPLEIAQAILFLTGAESSFVTGAALAVDGGRSFH
jgi:NAD(P)-dependent dehydrogenase (short-subunit alcohol dehydrogenase family)